MTPEEIDINLAELTTRIERVRALYEQYFMGFERTEPAIPRKDVERRVQDLRKIRFQNTAKRFKFQTLVQRYNSLQQYWTRVCRDIENGTYRKHVLKAEKRFADPEQAETFLHESAPEEVRERASHAIHAKEDTEQDLAALLESGANLDAELGAVLREVEARTSPGGKLGALGLRDTAAKNPLAALKRDATTNSRLGAGSKLELPQAKVRASRPPKPEDSPARENPLAHLTPKKPVPTAPSAPKTPGASGGAAASGPVAASGGGAAKGGLSDERIRAIHQNYLEARAKTNATAVSFEKLEQSLRETERKLREKNQGRNVDFDVSIRDGKAILKPTLK